MSMPDQQLGGLKNSDINMPTTFFIVPQFLQTDTAEILQATQP